MRKLKNIWLYFIIGLVLGSCSVARHIPEGKSFYEGASVILTTDSVQLKNKKEIKEELESFLRPTPNTKIAGVPYGAILHYKAEKRKINFISRFLNKKIGEEPVYLDQVDPERTIEILNNRLENRGFYDSEINFTVDQEGKFSSVTYEVGLNKPYVLTKGLVEGDSSRIYNEIRNLQQESLLKKGDRFNLEKFKAERQRIDEDLKNVGYYNFSDQYLIFEVDTTQAEEKEFIAYLRLKKNLPSQALKKYSIDTVIVYPNYDINKDTNGLSVDTLGGVTFIQKEIFFKPKRLKPFIFIEKGIPYSPKKSRLTSERLSAIEAYKYINIDYDIIDTTLQDSTKGLLKAELLLSPLSKYALRVQLQALSKSNNFIGPAVDFSFSNRNVFGGGEIWNASLFGGYEFQLLTGDDLEALRSTKIGLSTDLLFPRFLSPFNFFNDNKYSVPKTKIKVGYERLIRGSLFQLNTFNVKFGYLWKETRKKYHELFPININFVRLSNESDVFNEILDQNLFLRNSFRQEFIAGIAYSFTYNELNSSEKNTPIFLSVNTDIVGNTLNLINRIGGGDGGERIFGLNFAQYAKIDVDIRQYFRLKNKQVFIARLFTGVGLPYGNSSQIPFSRQFFSGGPFSVRSFRIHSLGPGTNIPDFNDLGSFFDQSGDIKLEANVEYRFPIISIIEGAIFVDAGNVWLLNENEDLPGGEFTSEFLQQIGAGTGLGLRANILNFAIRLDLGVPFMTPYKTDETINFELDRSVLNFAIGYPF